MSKSRILSIYERNQLLKYSYKETDLLTKGNLPVEYLTGFVNFAGLDLKVNPNVLIPRVETEELVALLAHFAQTEYAATSVEKFSYLEVGTGSGAISLAFFDFLLKQKKLFAKLDQFIVSDVSPKALALAQENFVNLFTLTQLNKVNFVLSDLLSNVTLSKFDLIVANLPYIPSAEIAKLDSSVKDHEPHLALDGGQTGFELIAKFLEQIIAKSMLKQKGQIFLEVYESHTQEFVQQNFPLLWQHFFIQEIKDQFDRQRFLILQQR